MLLSRVGFLGVRNFCARMNPDALWLALPEEVTFEIARKAFEQWACAPDGNYASMLRDGRRMALINRTFFQAFRPLHLMLCRDLSDPRHGLSFVQGTLLFLHRSTGRCCPNMHGFVHMLVYNSCTYKWLQPSGKRQNGCECARPAWSIKDLEHCKKHVCVQKRYLDALTWGLIHVYESGAIPVPSLVAQGRIIHMLCSWFAYVDRFHVANVHVAPLRFQLQQAFAVVNASQC